MAALWRASIFDIAEATFKAAVAAFPSSQDIPWASLGLYGQPGNPLGDGNQSESLGLAA